MVKAVIGGPVRQTDDAVEREVSQRQIGKYTRRATRLLLIVAAVAIALIVLMMFAPGR